MNINKSVNTMYRAISLFISIDLFLYLTSPKLFIINILFGLYALSVSILIFLNNYDKISNKMKLSGQDQLVIYLFLLVGGIVGFFIIVGTTLSNFYRNKNISKDGKLNIDNIDLNHIMVRCNDDIINIRDLFKMLGRLNNKDPLNYLLNHLRELYISSIKKQENNKES